MLSQLSAFVHSSQFWQWHGFSLSFFWLIGSSLGIYLKRKSVTYHLIAFLIVDYISLFFMLAALYLFFPKFPVLFTFSLIQQIHIIFGAVFLCLMAYQHVEGAVAHYKGRSSRIHRKLGTKIVGFGRILAALGWLIHTQNVYYSIGTAVLSVAMYLGFEREKWNKIKTV